MIPGWMYRYTLPDIAALKERKDYEGLTRALRNRDINVQWRAAQALGEIGEESVAYLIRDLENTRSKEARLGIIEALGMIRDQRAVPSLVAQLGDRSNEIRWEASLALGEIGDSSAIPALRNALEDEDKYVRYGAALSLQKLSWVPESEYEKALLMVGLQEWDRIQGKESGVVDALAKALRDNDRNIRLMAVRTMGVLKKKEAISALYHTIGDQDEEVRWESVQAASACGLPMRYLPRALMRRPRSRKNPRIAGFLNFMVPGMGYFYLGLWWGILIFQLDIYATLFIYTTTGQFTSVEILFPLYILLGIHAWYLAKKMPDL